MNGLGLIFRDRFILWTLRYLTGKLKTSATDLLCEYDITDSHELVLKNRG